MATKMKLPIIVLCIFIVLTIVFALLEKGKLSNYEELSTIEWYSEDYSIEEYSSELEVESKETQHYILDSEDTLVTTQITERVYAPVVEGTTKKAVEITVEQATTENKKKYTNERDILAKLLYCESGSTSWDCQVYTCSAILNLSDYTERSISSMASDINTFSVAPWVWSTTPTQTQYDVIDYVLSGGRISDVKYFRTDFYHNFGIPVTNIDNVYFSK